MSSESKLIHRVYGAPSLIEIPNGYIERTPVYELWETNGRAEKRISHFDQLLIRVTPQMMQQP